MKYKEITVTIHEKRNHPYAYGHYDCEVRLTADLGEEDDDYEDNCLDELADTARDHVLGELDAWEEGVIREHELTNRICGIENDIRGLLYNYGSDAWNEDVTTIHDRILDLPNNKQGKLLESLDTMIEKSKTWKDSVPF